MAARTRRLRGTEMESAMVPFLLRVDDEADLGGGEAADDEGKGDSGLEADVDDGGEIDDEKVVGNVEELKDEDGYSEGSDVDIEGVGSAADTSVDGTAAVQPLHYHCFSVRMIVVGMP
ncbi:MAG: hypothetical protein Q9165_002634 [Trypethelium subeluteriae]